ncbi:FAD-dependent oxidoreductase [Candidatus Bathyarchaeota archaeon]|nr:FAD-dependent oxidoreductase [Candidatus Bathyarchaeota archaeon]
MSKEQGKKIVIIGLGTGGLYSSRSAQRFNRNSQITIIEKRTYDMFSPCGIPYALEGKVKDFEDLKHTVPTTRGITKLLNHEAKKILPKDKKVIVINLENNKKKELSYDSLILATGSRPRILTIPGAHDLLNKGVYTCTTPEEGKILQEVAKKSKIAVVIGGGAIGLEIALALKHLGLEVIATKRSPQILGDELDSDMSEIINQFIMEEGIKNYFGRQIEKINGTDKVESVVIAGETIPCDLVVMATGIEPQSKLAADAGIKIDKGFIITDEKMRSSNPDIYAVGDVALSFNAIDSKPMNVALATTAFRQANIAGINAAGGNTEYEGNIGTFVTYFGGLEVSCTGFNSSTAETHGFKVVTGRANMKTKPNWMPDSKEISIKIIADLNSGQVLGGQAIGSEGTDWRINIIALAIKKKMTIQELAKIELAYCPAVSELYDPLMVAIDTTIRKIETVQRK